MLGPIEPTPVKPLQTSTRDATQGTDQASGKSSDIAILREQIAQGSYVVNLGSLASSILTRGVLRE
ncbi:MAG: flagellar biosynthesis anti-sigma factor FlgM [Acidibacillus sp.]|nr:flagellar biosynthesis anti-sigma factor FlgM [Acidibacillus sp.]